MPPVTSASVRSADEVNEQIRALWLRTGGRLSAEQRAQYERLVTEWADAKRAEVLRAA
ncbi:hypothetical protein OKJ48_05975 [Streptomyces kunmingensis]|uniref:Integrase n=1 Tax=Streptomyces kunmingensis TaxID=68225 RepID=A0ABU6C543_9ACTN|nr:hypothetical protein [Streptomyces kunmingensis]MEB3959799.1 hypothetical protein [Streptomyces kunmingensis]